MSGGPGVRARHMKAILAALDRDHPRAAAALRAALGADVVRDIETGVGLEWLAVEHNLGAAEVVLDALGRERADRFWRDLTAGLLRTPIFRPLVDGAVALFGPSPGSLARWVPRGWDVIYRRCGSWTVALHEPAEASLRLGELPAACAGSAPWLEAVASCLAAMLDLTRCEGAVELRGADAARGAAEFVLRWTRPGA